MRHRETFSADDADYTLLSDTPDADYVPVDDGAGDEIYPDDEYYPEDYPEDGGERYDESYADAPYGDYTEDAAYGADGCSQSITTARHRIDPPAPIFPAEDYGDIIPTTISLTTIPLKRASLRRRPLRRANPRNTTRKKDFEEPCCRSYGRRLG